MPGIDVDRIRRLHPQVSVRFEPSSVLLYHFGTRLRFLKDRRLPTVLGELEDAATAQAACRTAGIPAADMDRCGEAPAALPGPPCSSR